MTLPVAVKSVPQSVRWRHHDASLSGKGGGRDHRQRITGPILPKRLFVAIVLGRS